MSRKLFLGGLSWDTTEGKTIAIIFHFKYNDYKYVNYDSYSSILC